MPWLKDGINKVGSAKDNDVVLTKGPAHLGAITLKDGKATIALDAKADATIDGKKIVSAELLDDSHEKPTTVAFGTANFYVIDRNGKKGLRVKDSEAQTRKAFTGIDYFPIDPSWRVEAKWEPYQRRTRSTSRRARYGRQDAGAGQGRVRARRQEVRTAAGVEDKDAKELWFIFADATTSKQTYGSGRFLYADMPKDGKLVIDFNKAYNRRAHLRRMRRAPWRRRRTVSPCRSRRARRNTAPAITDRTPCVSCCCRTRTALSTSASRRGHVAAILSCMPAMSARPTCSRACLRCARA